MRPPVRIFVVVVVVVVGIARSLQLQTRACSGEFARRLNDWKVRRARPDLIKTYTAGETKTAAARTVILFPWRVYIDMVNVHVVAQP